MIALDLGDHLARIRVDGELDDRQWKFTRHSSDGPLHIATELRDAYHALFMSSSVAVITFDGLPDEPLTISTELLFSTPVQSNIENCGQPLWPESKDYVPYGDVNGRDVVRYDTRVDPNQGGALTTNATTLRGPTDAPDLTLTVGCFAGKWIHFIVNQLPTIEPGPTDVSMAVGSRDVVRSQWQAYGYDTPAGQRSSVYILPDGETLAMLSIAETVTIEVHSIDLGPLTFDLTGLFATPVQENIDACIFSAPGQTRMLPLPYIANGRELVDDQQRIWDRGPTSLGGTNVTVSLIAAEDLDDGGVSFVHTCDEAGPGIYVLQFPPSGYEGETVAVRWQVDDRPEVAESWDYHNTGHPEFFWPLDAKSLLEAIDDGSRLTLTIETNPQLTRVYDLAPLFSSLIQDSVDECVEADPPIDLSTVASPLVTQDGFSYRASRVNGAKVTSTFLWIAILDEEAPAGTGYSSHLVVTCVGSRIGLEIGGIGHVGGAVIAGDTVEVTWRANDGTPRTESWDAWHRYGRNYVSPQDDSVVFNAINGADTFSVMVASSPVFTETFELGEVGFWNTPVQPNLDVCSGGDDSD